MARLVWRILEKMNWADGLMEEWREAYLNIVSLSVCNGGIKES